MDDFFKKLLDSRERRYNLQIRLITLYKKPIISFMLNIPGLVKRTDEYVRFHKMGTKLIEERLGNRLLLSEYFDEDTGMYYLGVVDMDATDLKKEMIELENSDMGRLFDIDVFDENYTQITRNSLGLEPRKCILCDNVARICIRERIHSYQDLIKETNKIINTYI